MGSLDGKVAIVTGAAQGMGAFEARRLMEEGARVVLSDVQEEAGRELTRSLGADAEFALHDVSKEADWKAAVSTALARFGRLDILVNNAAVYHPCLLQDVSVEDFELHLRVNVMGVWHGVRQVVEPMRRAGGGSIVNKSSLAGLHGYPMISSYGITKWAVRGLTKYAAVELGQYGIRINSIHPGPVSDTGMFATSGFDDETRARQFLVQVPLKRFASPADVANLVVFLASDASRCITGREHVIDSGSSIS